MTVRPVPVPIDLLACPVCQCALRDAESGSELVCSHCGETYEVRDGVPILLSLGAREVLRESIDQNNASKLVKNSKSLVGRIAGFANPPSPILNTGAGSGYRRLRRFLEEASPAPRLLVVGCGDSPGEGMRALGKQVLSTCVNMDIGPFSIVNVVGTGDQLPFLSQSFDAVAIQAVLEHVPYPRRVVDEIYRVLKPGGYVYAEIPFLQAFHAGPGDYQRYTVNGIKILFEDFVPILTGVCCGPTSAVTNLLSNYAAVVLSMGNDVLYKILWRLFGWVAFPFRYLDLFLARLPNAYIVASGVAFLGRKAGFEVHHTAGKRIATQIGQ